MTAVVKGRHLSHYEEVTLNWSGNPQTPPSCPDCSQSLELVSGAMGEHLKCACGSLFADVENGKAIHYCDAPTREA